MTIYNNLVTYQYKVSLKFILHMRNLL